MTPPFKRRTRNLTIGPDLILRTASGAEEWPLLGQVLVSQAAATFIVYRTPDDLVRAFCAHAQALGLDVSAEILADVIAFYFDT